MKDIRGTLNPT